MGDKLTINQKLYLADLQDAGEAGLFPTELGEMQTFRSLTRRGVAEWRGGYVFITPAGRAAIASTHKEP